jgi:hypothetical protein
MTDSVLITLVTILLINHAGRRNFGFEEAIHYNSLFVMRRRLIKTGCFVKTHETGYCLTAVLNSCER